MLQRIAEIPRVEAATKPSSLSVTSNSISFHFETEDAFVSGTEQYYKYLVQYRVKTVSNNTEWVESLPLIGHPNNVTASRQALTHTINDLEADTEYEVQVAVCRMWDGVRGECSLAVNPIISIRTGEKIDFIWIIIGSDFFFQ